LKPTTTPVKSVEDLQINSVRNAYDLNTHCWSFQEYWTGKLQGTSEALTSW